MQTQQKKDEHRMMFQNCVCFVHSQAHEGLPAYFTGTKFCCAMKQIQHVKDEGILSLT